MSRKMHWYLTTFRGHPMVRTPFFPHKQKIVELFLGLMRFRGPVHAGFASAIALVAMTASCSHRHARAVTPSAPAAAGASETGVASWYGVPYHGRQTSSGEIYNMYAMTAAHRYLPFQTWVEVENLTNGKRVDVRINDRGPFVHADRVTIFRRPPRSRSICSVPEPRACD